MSFSFKLKGAVVNSSVVAALHTGSTVAGIQTRVDSLVLANIHATTETKVDVTIDDNSASTVYTIIANAVLPVGASLVITDLWLEADDILRAIADDSSVVEATIHYREIS